MIFFVRYLAKMFDLNLVKFCELFETGSYVDTVIFKNLVYNLQKTH